MRNRRNRALAWLWLAAAAVGLAQTQPPKTDEKPASVQGEVRNSVSGMPIERAHVSLRRYSSTGIDKYGALTNAEGKFRITGIPPGSYQVTLGRVGYVASLEATRTMVTLASDEKKENFDLKLVPVGAISGRVLDADGQPADGVQVHAEQGENRIRGGVTDDRGQYRIGGLGPGRYRVRAVTQNLPVPPEIRTDGTTDILYADTYHPGTLDIKGAARVAVGPGSDVTGIDIRLVRVPIVRMAGRVTGMPEGAKNVRVQVMRANGGQGAQVKPDGSFEIWRPDPGKYTLRAMNYGNAGEMLASAAVEVEVGDSDIDNIVLALLAPEEIRGQLEFEDEGARQAPQMGGGPAPTRVGAPNTPPAPPPRPQRRVLFREASGRRSVAGVSEDGTFTIQKVQPGKYIVSTQGYPAYVKSIRMGDTVTDGPVLNLNQGSGGARVTVTLSSAFGEVGGTVRDDKGPAAGARVVLHSVQAPRWESLNAASQADGTYRFQSVAPGTYFLQVLDQSESAAADYDGAETVEVRPRETLTRDLKVQGVK